jgi:hypothetical protein
MWPPLQIAVVVSFLAVVVLAQAGSPPSEAKEAGSPPSEAKESGARWNDVRLKMQTGSDLRIALRLRRRRATGRHRPPSLGEPKAGRKKGLRAGDPCPCGAGPLRGPGVPAIHMTAQRRSQKGLRAKRRSPPSPEGDGERSTSNFRRKDSERSEGVKKDSERSEAGPAEPDHFVVPLGVAPRSPTYAGPSCRCPAGASRVQNLGLKLVKVGL